MKTANQQSVKNGRLVAGVLLVSLVVAISTSFEARGDQMPQASDSTKETADGETPEQAPPTRKPVMLPGILIDFEKRCVDIDAKICLREGFLELVACAKGSKEHESIIAIEARPMHVHTALLLLGATNGNPAMRKPVDEEESRWVTIPPQGDLIDVFVVVEEEGKPVERPISDFVVYSEERGDEVDGTVLVAPTKNGDKKARRLPGAFLFAGSHLVDRGEGPRQYLADSSGHVLSIATFGDEVLCLPSIQTQENGALMWRIDPTHMPKIGTKVVFRLRPQAKPSKDKPTAVKPTADEPTPKGVR